MNPTVSTVAVFNLAQVIPFLETVDFWQRIKASDPDFAEFENVGVVPDAFYIDASRFQVVCYEVEDTHPVPIDKLEKYADLAFKLDCYEWTLHVVMLNRWGKFREGVDGLDLYHRSINDWTPIANWKQSANGKFINKTIKRLNQRISELVSDEAVEYEDDTEG
jgi:hypothetical protein